MRYIKNIFLIIFYSFFAYYSIHLLFNVLVQSYAVDKVGVHSTLVEYEPSITNSLVLLIIVILSICIKATSNIKEINSTEAYNAAIVSLKKISVFSLSAFALVLITVILNFHIFSFFGSLILRLDGSGGGITKTYALSNPTAATSIEYNGESEIFKDGEETVIVLLTRKNFIYVKHMKDKVPFTIYPDEVIELPLKK